MSTTTIARTFTREARCGHTYEAPKAAGVRALCDDCRDTKAAADAAEKAAQGTVTIGQWVRLDEGSIGQVWARSLSGMWWIADGLLFREMTSVQVADARLASVEDVADLFASTDVEDATEVVEVAEDVTPEPVVEVAPVEDRRGVVEGYTEKAHAVDFIDSDGVAVAACGWTVDPSGRSRIGVRVITAGRWFTSADVVTCVGCLRAVEAKAAEVNLRRMPAPDTSTAVEGIPAPEHTDTCGCADAVPVAPAAAVLSNHMGFPVIVVRDDVADDLLAAQDAGWTEWSGVGMGRSQTYPLGTPTAAAVRAVLDAVAADGRIAGRDRRVRGVDAGEHGGWCGVTVAKASGWDEAARGWREGADVTQYGIRSVSWHQGWTAEGEPSGWEFVG